jgi:hypothetical protein
MTPLLAYYGLKSGVRKIGAEPGVRKIGAEPIPCHFLKKLFKNQNEIGGQLRAGKFNYLVGGE